MWHVLLAGWPLFQHRVHQTGLGGPWLLLVSQQRVWRPLQILSATHGGQRGAGLGPVWGIVQMPHHVWPSMGICIPLAGDSLFPSSPGWRCCTLVVAWGLGGGGQGLEEAGHIVETLLGGLVSLGQAGVAPHGSCWGCLQGLWLWDDGIELEVLSIHRDIRSQSLQVQITQVPLDSRNNFCFVF